MFSFWSKSVLFKQNIRCVRNKHEKNESCWKKKPWVTIEKRTCSFRSSVWDRLRRCISTLHLLLCSVFSVLLNSYAAKTFGAILYYKNTRSHECLRKDRTQMHIKSQSKERRSWMERATNMRLHSKWHRIFLLFCIRCCAFWECTTSAGSGPAAMNAVLSVLVCLWFKNRQHFTCIHPYKLYKVIGCWHLLAFSLYACTMPC